MTGRQVEVTAATWVSTVWLKRCGVGSRGAEGDLVVEGLELADVLSGSVSVRVV